MFYIHSASTRDASDSQRSPTTNPDPANTQSRAKMANSVCGQIKYKSSIEPPTFVFECLIHDLSMFTKHMPIVLGAFNMTSDNDIHTSDVATQTDKES